MPIFSWLYPNKHKTTLIYDLHISNFPALSCVRIQTKIVIVSNKYIYGEHKNMNELEHLSCEYHFMSIFLLIRGSSVCNCSSKQKKKTNAFLYKHKISKQNRCNKGNFYNNIIIITNITTSNWLATINLWSCIPLTNICYLFYCDFFRVCVCICVCLFIFIQ